MTSLRHLTGNAAVYIGANILNAAIPFLLLPVLTRVLSPADYGTVAMFGIVVSILSAFTGVSVHGVVAVRYFQLNAANHRRYVGACLAILVASTMVVLTAVALLHRWLVALTGVPLDWWIIAVLVSAAQVVVSIRLSLWQVQRKAMKYGGFQISQSVGNAGLTLLFVLAFGWSWEGRVGAMSIATGCAALAAIALLMINQEFTARFDRTHIRDALKFGVPLIPHTLGGFLMTAVDRFMITNMLDIGQAGIYMVGMQIGMVLGLLTDSFNRAYAPWLMEKLQGNDLDVDKKIVKGTYFYFFCVMLLAIGIGNLAPSLFSLLVGEKFRAAADVTVYIALGYAFGGMYYMVTNYVFYYGSTARLALITLGSGILNIIFNYYLIKANGYVGAAQAFMLAQAFSFLGTWYLAATARKMPWLTFALK